MSVDNTFGNIPESWCLFLEKSSCTSKCSIAINKTLKVLKFRLQTKQLTTEKISFNFSLNFHNVSFEAIVF